MNINTTNLNITLIGDKIGVCVIPRESIHGACVVDAISNHRLSNIDKFESLEAELETILLTSPISILCEKLGIANETDVQIIDGSVFYKNKHIPLNLLRISLERKADGRFLRLLDRVSRNTISQNPERIYDFVYYNDLPVLDDGRIVAFKSVKTNFYDKFSGSISYYPGATPELELRYVNTKTDELCSEGLHFCSRHYLNKTYWLSDMRLVLLAVCPEDIASVPRYSWHRFSANESSKGRARKLESLCALKVDGQADFDSLNESLKNSTYSQMWADIEKWIDRDLPCSQDIENDRKLRANEVSNEIANKHYSLATLDQLQISVPEYGDEPHIERYVIAIIKAGECASESLDSNIDQVKKHFSNVFNVDEEDFGVSFEDIVEIAPYDRVMAIDVSEAGYGYFILEPMMRAM